MQKQLFPSPDEKEKQKIPENIPMNLDFLKTSKNEKPKQKKVMSKWIACPICHKRSCPLGHNIEVAIE